MVETLLLAGIVAAPLGSAGLFVPIRRRVRSAGFWPSTRRLILALASTCILAALVAAALRLLGVSRNNLVAAAAGLAFASLVWLPVTRRWNARAHLCWTSSVFLFVVSLTFALEWTFASHLGAASTVGGLVLWVFEVFAALLPGRSSKENRLAMSQRWAYLAGGIQWYGDLLGLIFLVFLLVGAANLATGGGELFRKLTPFLVGTVPVLVGLGLVRAVALLRRGTGASWQDAIGAFFIWQATLVVVVRASLLGLFARKAAFLRTPKTSERARWWEALRANWAKSALAMMGLAAIVGALTKATQLSGPLLAALLVFPTLGVAAAPFNSWAAQRAALPQELRDRRRTEYRRERQTLAAAAASAGAVAVFGAATAAVVLLLVPGHHSVHAPDLVGPARGHGATPGGGTSHHPAPGQPAAHPSRTTSPARPASTAPTSPSAASPSATSGSPTPSRTGSTSSPALPSPSPTGSLSPTGSP